MGWDRMGWDGMGWYGYGNKERVYDTQVSLTPNKIIRFTYKYDENGQTLCWRNMNI